MPNRSAPILTEDETEEVRLSNFGIRFAVRNDRGQLAVGDMYNLDMLGGVLPAVGDYFTTLWPDGDPEALHRVVARYYIGEFKGDNCWWLLVEDVEPSDIDLAMFRLARRQSEETRRLKPPEKGYADLLELRKAMRAAKADQSAPSTRTSKPLKRRALRRPPKPKTS